MATVVKKTMWDAVIKTATGGRKTLLFSADNYNAALEYASNHDECVSVISVEQCAQKGVTIYPETAEWLDNRNDEEVEYTYNRK